jgi:signal transduction histidine kinase
MAIHPRNHPFKLLLHFEWFLLIALLIGEVGRLTIARKLDGVVLSIPSLLLFLGLGLYLPQRSNWWKFFHLFASFLTVFILSFPAKLVPFPLLYIILSIRCALTFSIPARVTICGTLIATAVFVQFDRLPLRSMRIQHRFHPPPPPLEVVQERFFVLTAIGAVLLGLSIVFVQLLVNTVLMERRQREELAIANQRLREYALRVEDLAILQERNRIAREIHDSLGHFLTGINLNLDAANRLFNIDTSETKELIGEAKQLSSQALREVRKSVMSLRTNPLDGKKIDTVLRELIDEFNRTTKIKPAYICHIDIPANFGKEIDDILPVEVKIAIYRIVQEALTNISKYAKPTEVRVILTIDRHRLKLQVIDNGKGFQPSQQTSGFGLQGMMERIRALNGKLTILSEPQKGCTIDVEIPLL